VATNPLLNLFDNLSPAVKQSIMTAHGLAPNPADASQSRPTASHSASQSAPERYRSS
jgi:hypothetical protein